VTRALAAMWAALVLVGAAASAVALTPGGGTSTTDCLTEFGGTPANRPEQRPREIRCVDNDPACDDNPELGICRFRVDVCLNVADPALPECAPAELDTYLVENEQPDTNPRHDFDFQALEDRLNFLTLPVDATDQNVCSGETLMSLRLPIRPRIGGGSFRRGRKTLRTSIFGPGGVRDDDKLRMTCAAAEGTTPCDGVTSTFEQIQRHIFTATCAVPTCHNVAQGLHDLSLSAGEAYGNLVGVPANNPAANAAGKLRVDPGNPAGSFIVQKLRGELATDEGERMPFGLRRLKELNIELIEQWIAAGAPETGFVAAVGCH
jgi:hypothetical protein